MGKAIFTNRGPELAPNFEELESKEAAWRAGLEAGIRSVMPEQKSPQEELKDLYLRRNVQRQRKHHGRLPELVAGH